MFIKINEELAKKVMGYKDAKGFNPTSNIEDAWTLLEKLESLGLHFLVRNSGRGERDSITQKGYFCNIRSNDDLGTMRKTVAVSAPLAISFGACLVFDINASVFEDVAYEVTR